MIDLHEEDWIKDVITNETLSRDSRATLTSAMTAHLHSVAPPTATPQAIRAAKQELAEGICFIKRNGRVLHYDVMVLVPENPETHRTCFVLAPRYGGCVLKRLSEV